MKTRSGGDLSLARKRVHLGGCRVQEWTLDSNLWATLPGEILEEILAKLPFSSLIRLCSVCKGWKELIRSSKVFPRCSSSLGYLWYFSSGELFVFSSKRGTWETVPLDFLPRDLFSGRQYMDMSAGGLLSFSTSENDQFIHNHFILCNPLTQCYKTLQIPWREASTISDQACMPAPNQDISEVMGYILFAGMVPSCNQEHFKLIVAGIFEDSQGTTLVYDSQVNSWKKAANIPDSIFSCICAVYGRCRSDKWQPIACGGDLYFFYEGSYGVTKRLLKYDVEKELWSWIQTQKRPLSIIEHRGKLVLVTTSGLRMFGNIVVENDINKMLCFAAFELQDGGSNFWVPTNHFDLSRFNGNVPYLTCLYFSGKGDVVFLTSTNNLSKRISVRELVHDSDITSNCHQWFHDFEWEYPSHLEFGQAFKVFFPSTVLLGREVDGECYPICK